MEAMKEMIEKRKRWLAEIESQDNRCTERPIIIALQLRREHPTDPDYGQDGEWTEDGEGEKLDPPRPYKVHWEDEQHFFTYSAYEQHLKRNGHNYPQRRNYVKYAHRNPEWADIPHDFKTLIKYIEQLEGELHARTGQDSASEAADTGRSDRG